MSNKFVHLHLHTDYSMLDGLGKPVVYVDEAARRGDPALAITDHGTLSGVYEFYMACMKAGIKPIIGQEFYFVPNADIIKDEKIGERFHVVVLANNYDGFLTLIQLNNEAHRRFYYKPVIDRSVCEALAYEEAENLTVLSGCAGSILSRKALGEIPGSASVELQWWRETFPNFYVELQHHGTDFDRKLNNRLLKLAHRYKLPWVVTNDPHYVTKDQCDHHDALLAIQTSAPIDAEDRFRFSGTGYHLKTRREMEFAFRRYEQSVWKPGILNTLKIAKENTLRIPQWDNKSWHIPKYRKTPKGQTSFTYLRRLVIKGLQDKGFDNDSAYIKQAKKELRDIKSIEGFADFLLITREIIQWAVNNKTPEHPRGIPVGPGRGSTAGCLVAYLIGVHKCDPMRYGLLFERFLNPARPKMPDIDTDFSQRFRHEVMAHIAEEYGEENVLPVAAFQTMKVRGAFRKLATTMGMPFVDLKKFTDIMAAAWGKEGGEDDDIEDDEEDHIRVEHLPPELVKQYPDVVEYIEGIIGTKSAISRHASGIVIFDPKDDIRQCVPEMWVVSSKRFAGAFDLKSAEGMGLMKQDILGLRTLDTIDEAVTLIEDQTGELLDPDSWVPDEEEGDSEVYKMMAQGHNGGVFQIEGGTMATGIIKIKPNKFDDVIVCTSIYRKGPILAGAPTRYIENKKAKQIKVLHPSLKPILGDSYGEMAYQEQLMRIASEVAGFDQGGVADLLAAVRFKDEKMMAPLKEQFVKGCYSVSDIDKVTAGRIWSMMEKQASYLFNKSHAAAYTLLTYQTARLKCWWPLQYLTALMRTVPPKNDPSKAKRQAFLAEATDFGFHILPPDVNRSGDRFTCGTNKKGQKWMRFGFSDISGIGLPTADKILTAREAAGGSFKSMQEVRKHITPGLIKKLDEAGCLDSVGGSKRDDAALEGIVFWQFNDVMAPLRKKYADKVKLPGRGDGRVRLFGEVISHTIKKTKTNKNYMTWRIRWSPSEIFTITIWEDAESVWHTPTGSIVMVEGKYNSEYRNVSIGDHEQIRILRYAPKKKEAA